MLELIIGLGIVATASLALQFYVARKSRARTEVKAAAREAVAKKALRIYRLSVAREASEYTRIGSAEVLNLRDYYVMQGIRSDDGRALESPSEILSSRENWLIVGDAGFGKSTLANILVLETIETDNIPMPIHAREIEITSDEPDFLEEFLRYSQGPRYGCSIDLLDAFLLASRKGVVVVDGVDELEPRKQIALSRTLVRLGVRIPGIKIVVMSRPLEGGFEGWRPTFRVAHLLPFSEDDVYRFSEKWLSGESAWVLETLAEMVRDSPRVRDLLRIPLFLELSLFVVNRLGEGGTNRKKLLEMSVEELISGEARRRRKRLSRFTGSEVRAVLTRLAGFLDEKNRSLLSRDDLLEGMREYLVLDKKYTTSQADEFAARFVEDFMYKNGLLRFAGGGYGFLHKAFADFFVAEGLVEKREEAFRERVSEGEAAEVCLLLLHSMKDPTAEVQHSYKKGLAAHARVVANAIVDGVSFDFGREDFADLVVDILGEDGIQESRFEVVRRTLRELPPDEGEKLKQRLKVTYSDRPEILAVIQEAERGIGPSVKTLRVEKKSRGRSIRLIAESQAATRALADLLDELKGDVPFDVDLELYDAVEVTNRVAKDLSSDSEARYDVVVQPHRRLGWLVTQGLVQPLNRFLASHRNSDAADPTKTVFQDWWKEMSWYGGLCYGFPLVALTMYVWLRKDLIENLELQKRYEDEYHSVLEFPRTIREFRQVALFLAGSGAVRYGLALQGRSRVGHGSGPDHLHPGLYHEWLNFLYAYGGRVLEQEFGWEYGPIVVNSPEAIESLRFYASLYDPAICHPDCLKFTWDNIPKVMADGEAAMCVMWNDAVYDVARRRDGMEFCFGVLPGVDGAKATQSDGWSMLVPVRARDPESSYAFMEWILGEEIQVELQRRGGASPIRSVYSDPLVRALPYTEVSLAAMETRVPRETIPESEIIWKVLTKQLERVIRRELSARRALCEVARQLEEDVLARKTGRRFAD